LASQYKKAAHFVPFPLPFDQINIFNWTSFIGSEILFFASYFTTPARPSVYVTSLWINDYSIPQVQQLSTAFISFLAGNSGSK